MKAIFLLGFAVVLWGCGGTPTEDETVRSNEDITLDTREESDSAWADNLLEELEVTNEVLQITEFFDYSCPHCRVMQEVLSDLEHDYGDKIEITSKPLVVYESSRGAALAAECVRDQKLWEGFHQSLFALQGQFNEQTIPGLVHDLEVDKELFSACIASGVKHKVLEQYQRDAEAHGVAGTPSFVINNSTVISGGYPPKIFASMIKNMVKK